MFAFAIPGSGWMQLFALPRLLHALSACVCRWVCVSGVCVALLKYLYNKVVAVAVALSSAQFQLHLP